MTNPNILALRYATKPMRENFSQTGTIRKERDLWIAVMEVQRELGVDIPGEDIEKFAKARDDIDLEMIEKIERRTKHDVKGKIEAYVHAAGAREHIHRGMTSRDLTDNVEQMQIAAASRLVFAKFVSVLRHFADKAKAYEPIELTGRTHHQAAQTTLLGRRMSMWAEELYLHTHRFESFIEEYPLRGMKGPVGTQFDMLTLLGSKEKVAVLEQRVATKLGFSNVLSSPGQVYPRSLDSAVISNLALLTAGCENFAKGMRLMAGYELVTEGFKEGQVGSSAMPHKMNTRSAERICSLAELVKMYADGASRISGDQWEEGDVSCSAIRRIIMPDSFYAIDGLCETTLTVLNEMGVYPAVISKEVDRYLPFMASTELLTMATQAGVGREKAHETIKRHSVSEALRMRNDGADKNDLASLLSADQVFIDAGITRAMIDNVLVDKSHFVGNASMQLHSVCTKIERQFTSAYTAAAAYEPGEIL